MTILSCCENYYLFRLAKVQKHLLTKISLLYTPTTSNLVLTNWLIMRVTPIICRVSNYVYSINALLKKCELLVSLIKWFFGSLLKQRLCTNHEKMMIFLSLITSYGQIKIFDLLMFSHITTITKKYQRSLHYFWLKCLEIALFITFFRWYFWADIYI